MPGWLCLIKAEKYPLNSKEFHSKSRIQGIHNVSDKNSNK
uniref:Uncharacterized protein n=1 Tax=Rhizophora mucronata TaxID=61149 RepID=A0A2P2JFY2_RHIMU